MLTINFVTLNPFGVFECDTKPYCGIVLCENETINMEICHRMGNSHLAFSNV